MEENKSGQKNCDRDSTIQVWNNLFSLWSLDKIKGCKKFKVQKIRCQPTDYTDYTLDKKTVDTQLQYTFL